MKSVGVVGAGVMGAGVCEDLLESGIPAVLVDLSDEILKNAQRHIRNGIRGRAMLNSRKNQEPLSVLLERVTFSTDIHDLSGVDIVIENVTEDVGIKRSVYKELDEVCSDDCILIGNTSCVPISRLASFTRRPDKVIGVHFMNPVPLKKTVELIAGEETSADTIAQTQKFLAALGKESIQVKDSPGFVSNRVLMLTINEAINLVQEGVADAESVDAIFTDCFGHAMGPLATGDLIGLDTIRNSLLVLRDSLGDDKFKPCSLLDEMVASGALGRKSGSGFFAYS